MPNLKTSWIVIPNGLKEGKFSFSALASFLHTGNLAADVARFLPEYSTFLQSLQLENKYFVVKSGANTMELKVATNQGSFPESLSRIKESVDGNTWQPIFNPLMLQDLGDSFQFSAQAEKQVEFVDFHDDYFKSGAVRTDEMVDAFSKSMLPADRDTQLSLFADLASRVEGLATTRKEMFGRINQDRNESSHYHPQSWQSNPKYDVRDIIAELLQEPEVLRMLGLLIDFEVEGFPAADGDYSIELRWPFAQNSFFSPASQDFNPFPRTHVWKKGQAIGVIAKNRNEYFDGLLKITSQDYQIVLHDPDQRTFATEVAFSSLLSRFENFGGEITSFTSEQKEELSAKITEVMPSLPTEGFMLFKKDRSKSEGYDGLNPAEVSDIQDYKLDDIALGFAVAVIKSKAPLGSNAEVSLRSLVHKELEYRIQRRDKLKKVKIKYPVAGWITTDSAMMLESAQKITYALSNKLFRWDGFSLICEHPLRDIVEDDQDHDFGMNNPADQHVSKFVDKASEVPAERSLERLRFGFHYSFVMWPITLNGFSPALSAIADIIKSDTNNAQFTRSASARFTRSEPIGTPKMAMTYPLKQSNKMVSGREGESMFTLVIRNNNYENRDVPTRQITERYIFPPSVSFRMAEWHGGIDAHYDKLLSISSEITSQPLETAGVQWLQDKMESQSIEMGKVRDLYERSKQSLPESVFDLDNKYIYQVDGEEWNSYQVPYLSDPTAVGFSLKCIRVISPQNEKGKEVMDRMNASLAGKRFKYFDDTDEIADKKNGWPRKLFAWRLEVREHKNGDYISIIERKQDGIIRVQSVIMRIPKGFMLEFEIESTTNNNYLSLFSEEVRTQLTPAQKFTVVHAVQRPLTEPRISYFKTERIPGDPSKVKISGIKAEFDQATTGQLELHAKWKEYTDDIKTSAPEEGKECEGLEFPDLLKPDGSGGLLTAFNIDQRDTKFRSKDLRLKAVSKYQEYFVNPDIPATSQLDFSKTGGWLEVGNAAGLPKAPEHLVLNNAMPSPPQVEYLMPVIQKTRQEAGKTITIDQSSGGTVAYIKRPHYITGAEEEFCLVLRNKQNEDLVSRVGEDAAARRSGLLISNSLKNMGSTFEKEDYLLMLLEKQFDEVKGLWKVKIPMVRSLHDSLYFPFYQFALVRYQPWSTPGNYVSKVVMADFVQPVPVRKIEILQGDEQVKMTWKKDSRVVRAGNVLSMTLECLHRYNHQDSLLWRPYQKPAEANVDAITGSYVEKVFAVDKKDKTAYNFRVRVEEYETFPSQGYLATDERARRLVYSEIVDVKLSN